MNKEKESHQERIIKSLYSYQNRIESLLLFVAIVAIVLFKLNNPVGLPLLIISLSTLATLYYFLAFRKTELQDAKAIFLNKLRNISFSVGMIGILFAILNWPNAKPILITSFVSLLIVGALEVRFSMKNATEKSGESFAKIRFAIIFIATVCMLFFYR